MGPFYSLDVLEQKSGYVIVNPISLSSKPRLFDICTAAK